MSWSLLLIPLLVLLGAVAWYAHSILRLAVAYKAKILCSGMFVAGRTPSDLLRTDLALDHHRFFR